MKQYIKNILNFILVRSDRVALNENLIDLFDITILNNRIFTLSFLAIAIKLANADSLINQIEKDKIIKLINNNISGELDDLITILNKEDDNPDIYVKKIINFTSFNTDLYNQIISKLIDIALIDNNILFISELNLIKRVAKQLGVADKFIINDLQKKLKISSNNIENILGINATSRAEELKRKYKYYIKNYHPDLFSQYENISTEFMSIVQDNFIKVHNFYANKMKQFHVCEN